MKTPFDEKHELYNWLGIVYKLIKAFYNVLMYTLWKPSSAFASVFLVLSVKNIFVFKLCSEYSLSLLLMVQNRIASITPQVQSSMQTGSGIPPHTLMNAVDVTTNTEGDVTETPDQIDETLVTALRSPRCYSPTFQAQWHIMHVYVCVSVCMCMHTISIYVFQGRNIQSNSVMYLYQIINILKKGITTCPRDVMRGITNIKERDCLRENLTDMN